MSKPEQGTDKAPRVEPLTESAKSSRAANQAFMNEYAGSVFRIDTESSSGTAWAIDARTVITDYHVIANKREIVGRNAAGEVFKLGKEVWVDPLRDLAMLTIEGSGPTSFRPLPLGSSLTLKAGDVTTSMGWKGGESLGRFPGQYQGRITELEMYKKVEAGATSREEKHFARHKTEQAAMRNSSGIVRQFLEMTNNTGPGASGGPDLDSTGKVIGVIDAGLPNHPGRALSNPVEYVQDLFEHRERYQKLEGYYEHGLALAVRNGLADPKSGLLKLMGVSTAAAGAVGYVHGFASAASSMKLAVPGVLGLLGVGTLTQSDMTSLISSTSALDKTKYSTAIVFDGVLIASLVTATIAKKFPGLSMASRVLLGVGAVGRTATELIPNRFVVDIGDSRP